MYVINVIPFSQTAPAGTLSYRSSVNFSIGSLVSVPLRQKQVPGVVTSCVPVQEAKAEIKAASFVLRSGLIERLGELPSAYEKALTSIAKWNAIPFGRAANALFPSIFFEQKFPLLPPVHAGNNKKISFIETTYLNRRDAYNKYVQRAYGDNTSVLFVVPTIIEATRLSEYIPDAVVITGYGSKKRRKEALEKTATATAIITTPYYAFLPITRLTRIVIERESAESYVLNTAPHIDIRYAIGALARERKIPLTYGDYPLRIEVRPKKDAPLSLVPYERITLLDMQKKDRVSAQRMQKFSAVPQPIIHALSRVVCSGGNAAVVAVRKGYAPAVVCRDCGTTVRDSFGRAMSLATINGARVLRCSDGSIIRDARVVCNECGSWNLLPLGIGVERVLETLRKELPNAHLVQFDTDTIRTPVAARHAATSFSKPGTIIVGTEILLQWLNPETPLSLSVIASADTLLALPFWRSRERFVRLALTLAERSEKLIVATRQPNDTANTALMTPDAIDFLKEEDNLRALVHYPPYGHLLIIRLRGNDKQLLMHEKHVRTALAPHKLTRLPDQRKGKALSSTVRTLVAKLKPDEWPDSTYAKRLEVLPISVSVSVDSESLWTDR